MSQYTEDLQSSKPNTRVTRALVYTRKAKNIAMNASVKNMTVLPNGAWVSGLTKLDSKPGGGGAVGI